MTAAWLGVAGFVAASRRTASRIASGTRTFSATVGAPRRARGAYPPGQDWRLLQQADLLPRLAQLLVLGLGHAGTVTVLDISLMEPVA